MDAPEHIGIFDSSYAVITTFLVTFHHIQNPLISAAGARGALDS